MAYILLLETATDVCGVGIARDGVLISMSEQHATQQHATLLTSQIAEVAKQAGITLAELDAVAISHGPGSYTGLRVGASVAKGICYALKKPLLAVDTLRVLAQASARAQEAPDAWHAAMIDARRQEVWMAVYDARGRVQVEAQPFILENALFEKILAESIWAENTNALFLSGNGCFKARSYQMSARVRYSGVENCSVGHMAHISFNQFESGDFQDVAYYEPFYMKPPNITFSSNMLRT
ncbi:MAG: tRNA (adenosine(37)-N6)-threonylcarbamoyltransferase complex dimerization subunit type 1 TsaB [Bacteroidetes bacterium]|nr:tRNA (adenosine(37)-N6)-threonylcarbamoyltransferase complex dimerization subunit type 1 TsaB [Bacteroidota bacterium]